MPFLAARSRTPYVFVAETQVLYKNGGMGSIVCILKYFPYGNSGFRPSFLNLGCSGFTDNSDPVRPFWPVRSGGWARPALFRASIIKCNFER